MRSKTTTGPAGVPVMLVLLLLLGPAALPAARAQPAPVPAQATATDPAPTLAAVQVQTLESTRKAAELALEQNRIALEQARKTFELAIEQNKLAQEQTRKTAELAIQAAQASNEYVKTIVGWGAALLAAVGVLLGTLGYREMKQVRDDFKDRLAKTIEPVRKKFEREARERLRKISLLCIEIATFTTTFEAVPTTTGTAALRTLCDSLFARADLIYSLAKELMDERTEGWIWGQRALLHYYLKEFRPALKAQTEACEFIVPHTRFDRERNLACIASRLFESEADESAFELSAKTLKEMTEYINPERADELLKDADLTAVYARAPEVRAQIQLKA